MGITSVTGASGVIARGAETEEFKTAGRPSGATTYLPAASSDYATAPKTTVSDIISGLPKGERCSKRRGCTPPAPRGPQRPEAKPGS